MVVDKEEEVIDEALSPERDEAMTKPLLSEEEPITLY